ncbi:hypothetical protein SUDANB120_01647 [Streptomyces sp. enrichment culture]
MPGCGAVSGALPPGLPPLERRRGWICFRASGVGRGGSVPTPQAPATAGCAPWFEWWRGRMVAHPGLARGRGCAARWANPARAAFERTAAQRPSGAGGGVPGFGKGRGGDRSAQRPGPPAASPASCAGSAPVRLTAHGPGPDGRRRPGRAAPRRPAAVIHGEVCRRVCPGGCPGRGHGPSVGGRAGAGRIRPAPPGAACRGRAPARAACPVGRRLLGWRPGGPVAACGTPLLGWRTPRRRARWAGGCLGGVLGGPVAAWATTPLG